MGHNHDIMGHNLENKSNNSLNGTAQKHYAYDNFRLMHTMYKDNKWI